VALVPGMTAREVAVAALGTAYAIEGADNDPAELGRTLTAHWSLATALSLLAWYVFAPQCARHWMSSGAKPTAGSGLPSCSVTCWRWPTLRRSSSITRRSRSALNEDLLDDAPCRSAMLELPMPNPIREMVKRE
jgi:hypothetical protein